jgi:hypothetical protein
MCGNSLQTRDCKWLQFSATLGIEMPRRNLETRSQNLTTCRATPTEEATLKRLVKQDGFARITDFWRRCLETYLAQKAAGQKLKWPFEFVQIEESRKAAD